MKSESGKKISICVFIMGFHDGGIEKVIENYFTYMDRSNFDLHMVIHMNKNQRRKEYFENLGFKIHELSYYRGHRVGLKHYKEYKKLFSENHFDIVHNNCVQYILPLYFAKKYNVPVRILHSHSDFNDALKDRNVFAKYFYHKAIHYNVGLSNCYFACGERAGISVFGKEHIKDIIVIKNALDIDKFLYNTEARKKIREQYELGNSFVIGHVGRYEDEYKNQEFVVDIFSELRSLIKNSKLILVGDGPRRKNIEQLVKDKDLSKHVIFTGNVENVNEYLSAMDFFVFPSKYEGLSQVVVEAQCSGLRGIMTDTLAEEMNVLGSFITESLESSARHWADRIVDEHEYVRENKIKEIERRGYNIRIEAKKLEDFYKAYSTSVCGVR